MVLHNHMETRGNPSITKSDQSEQHLEIFTLCTTLNLKHATQLP